MRSYEGVAVTCPVSLTYFKQTHHTATWFVGGVLRELLDCAGIEKQDVDGFAVSSFSLAPDSVAALTQHFNLSPRWIEEINLGGVSGLVALRRAARAIQAGDVEIVACIGADTANHRSFESIAANFSSWSVDAVFPYGAAGPNLPFSLITEHYMRRYDVRREDFARICLDQRYNANHYDNALLGKKPLSLEAYLGARAIAGPLHLFDCVMPCAGGEGFLMMSEERARHLGLKYVTIAAANELHNAHSSDPIQIRGGWTQYIAEMYEQGSVGPEDIDCLQTYDDYPVISMMQMEDLLFCPKGDGARFVQETDMRFDGSGEQRRKLPHNTSGGQLSCGQAGSAGGYLGLTEALKQLTQTAGRHQVKNVRTSLISGYGMVNYDRGLCSAAAILKAG
jgi:acetyl-CoA acetyltransferase